MGSGSAADFSVINWDLTAYRQHLIAENVYPDTRMSARIVGWDFQYRVSREFWTRRVA